MRSFKKVFILILMLAVALAGAAIAGPKYFPESGKLDVDEATQWELERRQAQDGMERVAEMAYFGNPDHVPGNTYYIDNGMLYDSEWEPIGVTDERNGTYTLGEDLDFFDRFGVRIAVEDESTYTVQPNDGWWVVSKRMGIPMDTLKEMNNSIELHPGTILTVHNYGEEVTVTNPATKDSPEKSKTFKDVPVEPTKSDPKPKPKDKPAKEKSSPKSENKPSKESKPFEGNDFDTTLLALVNEARANKGLNPLRYSDTLNSISNDWADEMAEDSYMRHSSDFDTRTFNAGGIKAAENVAMRSDPHPKDSGLARQFFSQWMNSPGHRANILDPSLTHMGSGFATDSRGYAFASQNFGTF